MLLSWSGYHLKDAPPDVDQLLPVTVAFDPGTEEMEVVGRGDWGRSR
jgi:hypothetical protein